MTQPDPAMTQNEDTEDTHDVVLSDLLVEEVSIDGMCGVY
jgi:mycofactocin precursor